MCGFSFPEWNIAPFLYLSLSLVYLGASLPGVLSVNCDLPGVHLTPSRLPHSSWFPFFLLLSIFVMRFHISTAYLSLNCHLRGFSTPAFPRYYLLSPHALFFSSLAVLGLSARLPFPHFSYSAHGSPSSFYPSCSSLHFRSFGALLTRSNLRFPPRRGPPFGPGQFPIRFFSVLFWLVVLRMSLGVYASVSFCSSSSSCPVLVLFQVGLLLDHVLLLFRGSLVWNWVSVTSFLYVVFFRRVSITSSTLLFGFTAFLDLCLSCVCFL